MGEACHRNAVAALTALMWDGRGCFLTRLRCSRKVKLRLAVPIFDFIYRRLIKEEEAVGTRLATPWKSFRAKLLSATTPDGFFYQMKRASSYFLHVNHVLVFSFQKLHLKSCFRHCLCWLIKVCD